MKKIYISGKITSCKDYQKRFEIAEKKLKEKGFEVVNPCLIPLEQKEPCYADYMRADIRELISCDFIFMLKNWRFSRGARFERKTAKILNIPVFYERNV